MTVVLGQEAEGTGAAVTLTRPVGFRFISGGANVADSINAKLTGGTATEVWFAIAVDGAEGKVPGAVISGSQGKATIASLAATLASLAVSLSNGTAYWLIVGPVSGAIKLKRTASTEGESHRSVTGTTVGVLEPSAVSAWTAEQTGPMAIWATGAPAGVLPLAAGAASSTASLAVSAKTQVPLGAGAPASAASAAVTAPALIGMNAAVAASAATGMVAVPNAAIEPDPASCVSAAALAVSAPVLLAPAAGASVSTASADVIVPVPAVLGLDPAVSAAAGSFAIAPVTTLLAGSLAHVEAAVRSAAAGQPQAQRVSVTPGTIVSAKFWTGTTVGGATSYVCAVIADNAGVPGSTVYGTVAGNEPQSSKGQRLADKEATGSIPPGVSVAWLAILPLGGSILIEYSEAAGVQPYKSTSSTITSFGQPITWVQFGSGTGTGPADMGVLGLTFPGAPVDPASSASSASVGVSAATGQQLAPAQAQSAAVGLLGHPALIDAAPAQAVSSASAQPSARALVSASALAVSGAAATVRPASGLEVPYGPEPQQWVDVWKATNPGSPCVIFVSGGGFTIDQAVSPVRPDAEGFWESTGWNVYNADYRHATSTLGSFWRSVEDVEAAVAYARQHATQLNGDPSRVILIGGSAGTTLALLAAARLNTANPGTVKGVACLSPIGDLRKMVEQMETGAYREEPWGSFANGVFSNSGGAGFLESATANFTGQAVGYIVKSAGHVGSKCYVKAVISPTKVELSEEVTAGAGATFALNHSGGSVNNLTENIQEALQQNLVYTAPYAGEAGVSNPNPANPATNLPASREAQEAASPTRLAFPAGCRVLLINDKYDLLEADQYLDLKAALLAQGVDVKGKLVEAPSFVPGHAFGYWGASIEGKLMKLVLKAWIEEPEAAIVQLAPAKANATGAMAVLPRQQLALDSAASVSSASGDLTAPTELLAGSATAGSAASIVLMTGAEPGLAPAQAASAGALFGTATPLVDTQLAASGSATGLLDFVVAAHLAPVPALAGSAGAMEPVVSPEMPLDAALAVSAGAVTPRPIEPLAAEVRIVVRSQVRVNVKLKRRT